MSSSQKFDHNPLFHIEKFDNEILLYSVSKAEGVYLNETAYLVWEMCSKSNSIEEIVTLLEKAYPGQKDAIREDVHQTIESLVNNGALIARDDISNP